MGSWFSTVRDASAQIDSEQRVLAQMRELGARWLLWLRLLLAIVFGSLAIWVGAQRQDPNLQLLAIPLGVAAVAFALILVALRVAARGRVLHPLTVVLALLLSTWGFLWRIPHAGHTGWLSFAAAVMFVVEVSFASISVLSVRFVVASCIVAIGCEGLLVWHAGAGLPLWIAATALIAAAGAFTTTVVSRFERLAQSLVEGEIARHSAHERSSALELARAQAEQVNAELDDQHRRLVLAQRDAETMTSRLVHEMKQPLASVLGLIDLVADELREQPAAASALLDLAAARTQGQRLLSMVDDLLAIARLEHGTLATARVPTTLVPLLDSVVARQPLRSSRIEVSVRGERELTAPLDRELIERLLENMLARTLLLARAGDAVELSAARDDHELVLAVKRTGQPVPVDARAMMFEKFSGGPATDDRSGAGLGLYFCRLIAEAHGGRIALEDDPRFAAALVVRLPLAH